MGKVSRAINKSSVDYESKNNEVSRVPQDNDVTSSTDVMENIIVPSEPPRPVNIPHEENTGVSWDERLVMSTEYHSSIAENFRKLRTLILHPENEKPAQSILAISASAQEGKSFICANLGVSISSGIDKRALIIDSDLRRPSLHNLFGHTNSQGFVDYLNGRKSLPELVLRTQLPNLSILPSGTPPSNPAELISSEHSTELIKEILDNYNDHIVILDSPPLLAASETLVLSQLVDKVILVVRWGKPGREEVKKVVEQIGREKIIGVVFNAFEMNILDRKVQDAGYYHYYSDSYY